MTNETITISIDAGFIDAAMQCVSKEETRHYLKGVFLDARGFVVATNGHMAFAGRCNDAFKLQDVRPAYDTHAINLAGVIVPSEAVVQAGKAAGRSKGLYYTVERDAQGLWWILYGNARVHFAPVDGAFPEWTRIVPNAPETLVPGHYQPQYIAALGKIAQALRDGKKDAASQFRLHQNGDNPALVTFPRPMQNRNDERGPRSDCLAVLMPMRTYPEEYAAATLTETFIKN